MGNTDSKCNYREALAELTGRSRPIDPADEEFWSQFFYDNHLDSIDEMFAMFTAQEIRTLRDETPLNLATLCYKAVEHLVRATDTLCNTQQQQRTVLTCVALLTRILPYLFEDADWRRFFWSTPGAPPLNDSKFPTFTGGGLEGQPLAQSLLLALADLLFCPDFTVADISKTGGAATTSGHFGQAPDTPPEDLQSIDSCEYIWEAGVGCSTSQPTNASHDHNRTELLRLILTCFSESMYMSTGEVGYHPNPWIELFTSNDNRHALPLFTSMLNTVFAYNPNSIIPFNHWLFSDAREPLVEVALQILIVGLDHDFSQAAMAANAGDDTDQRTMTTTMTASKAFRLSGDSLGGGGAGPSSSVAGQDNLFILYISRIHREDDFDFLLQGFTRLLNNPIQQSYLPASGKRIHFHQELLVLFWKLCDYNKKFMFYVLKTCDVLKILVPILYHLNEARADRSQVGLVHIGVFIILLLSGERNFGVRLNRPYLATVPMDLPIFSGTHADLLVIVFHKLITTGHQRLQPLFDCLLTILVNVSPYLKTLSMVASAKILHLLEAFSTPWFLFTNPTNHHLVFFLLEIFNNIIQYQFDGNANLMYTIIKKRTIFHHLANLPTDYGTIQRSLNHHQRSLTSQPRRSQTVGAFNSAASLRQAEDQHQEMVRVTRQHSQQHQHHHHHHHHSPSPSSMESTRGPDLSAFPQPSRAVERRLASSTSGPIGTGLSNNRNEDGDNLHQNQSGPSTREHNINVTLAALPKIDSMTEKTHAHNNSQDGQQEPEKNIETIQHEQTEGEDEGDLEHIIGGMDPLMSEAGPSSMLASRRLSKKGQARRQQFTSGSVSYQSSTASDGTATSVGSSLMGHHTRHTPQPHTPIPITALPWQPSSEWIMSWKPKLPLQTIMRMLQVLVPQVEKMCLDKGITDENEILRFLQHGTLVGLLPVPHPILIRKYQTNIGTTIWFRTYMWGVIYLRNARPPIWYDTTVKLFEIQKS